MHPPAYPHDQPLEIFPNVYFIQGSIKMGPGMTMNRNMVVLKQEDELTLINPVRLNEQGLAELSKLGNIKRIMRLGDFHGLDDAFYLDTYHCEFWAQAGQATYPDISPSHIIDQTTESPIANSEFFIFQSARYPEAALLLHEHKLLITTDSVQYHKNWAYFSWFTKFAFKLIGFKIGLNIGPPWLKRFTPKGGSLEADFGDLLQLDFNAVVGAHGQPLFDQANKALKQEVSHTFN